LVLHTYKGCAYYRRSTTGSWPGASAPYPATAVSDECSSICVGACAGRAGARGADQVPAPGDCRSRFIDAHRVTWCRIQINCAPIATRWLSRDACAASVVSIESPAVQGRGIMRPFVPPSNCLALTWHHPSLIKEDWHVSLSRCRASGRSGWICGTGARSTAPCRLPRDHYHHHYRLLASPSPSLQS
jgi:hypothetical protein